MPDINDSDEEEKPVIGKAKKVVIDVDKI